MCISKYLAISIVLLIAKVPELVKGEVLRTSDVSRAGSNPVLSKMSPLRRHFYSSLQFLVYFLYIYI